MDIQFGRKDVPIPMPSPAEHETLVKCDTVWLIPSEPPPSPSDYTHRLAKLIFFAWHEGPWLTWRKAKAVLFQRSILRHQKVVLVAGKRVPDGAPVLAMGVQACPEAAHMCFPAEYVVEAHGDERQIEDIRRLLSARLAEDAALFDEVWHYSPFSGRPLRFGLDTLCPDYRFKSASSANNPLPHASSVRTRPQTDIHKGRTDVIVAGAGSYLLSYVLPHFRSRRFRLHTVVDLNPLRAARVAKAYGFHYAATSTNSAFEALPSSSSPVLIIATYHSTHVAVAETAYRYCPQTRIFMEKPPVTDWSQLTTLEGLRSECFIEIGYNRRYAPFVRRAKQWIDNMSGPTTMTCIVKELNIPATHWYYWPTQGTRLTGNLSHWIDLGIHFISAKPSVVAIQSASQSHFADEVSASVSFDDGSLLTLVASDRGNSTQGVQECIEIRRGDATVRIDDFRRLTVWAGGREKAFVRRHRDKGHSAMYRTFVDQLTENEPRAQYPNDDLRKSSLLYLTMVEMLRDGKASLHL